MNTFRHRDEQRPPAATTVTDVAITRFEGVYEVDPRLMGEHLTQQQFPNWDTLRIVGSRHDHLEWMHRHWAATVVSGDDLLQDLAPNPPRAPASPPAASSDSS